MAGSAAAESTASATDNAPVSKIRWQNYAPDWSIADVAGRCDSGAAATRGQCGIVEF
jgi:hypothetical protein